MNNYKNITIRFINDIRWKLIQLRTHDLNGTDRIKLVYIND